jgi:uncharacterized surface protein with fasciclin (FAS1) repeats
MPSHFSSLRRFTRLASAALALSLAGMAQAQTAAPTSSLSAYLQCRHAPLTNFNGTIVDAAVATPELSTLVSLVVAADLAGALSGKGPLTVYAPTNDAFAKVPGALVDLLAANPPLLTSVLTYHVSPGTLDPRRATSPMAVKTLQGQSVFFGYGKSGPTINQSGAACKGVKTTNGVVWIIDSVLLPQFK